MSNELLLYSYWRSSAAFRVRIALNLKQLPYQLRTVDLRKDGGEQRASAYRSLNPQQLVPLLCDGETRIAQSLAIFEYLDEAYPAHPLLPSSPKARAKIRALALHIACDIHPLNNLRVLQYLQQPLAIGEPAIQSWYQHWIAQGFAAVEAGLQDFDSAFSLGERPGYLEACLVPQLYNARRFNCALDAYPRLQDWVARCEQLEAFQRAAPHNQPDAG